MAVAAAPYEGVFQRALLELKFRRREVLAELLAGPAVYAFRHASRDPEAGGEAMLPVAVLPVPLPFWRRRRRGFNQSEQLASPVARSLGIPLVRSVLRRRARPPQTLMSPSARRRNVRGAFRVRRLPEQLVGRPLLLVDDVFTTGSTVEAAVRTLIRAGAGPVDVLTVARSMGLGRGLTGRSWQPVDKGTRPGSPAGGLTAGGKTQAAQFSRWGLLPHEPCQPGPSPPPGELTDLGAHPGSTTGC